MGNKFRGVACPTQLKGSNHPVHVKRWPCKWSRKGVERSIIEGVHIYIINLFNLKYIVFTVCEHKYMNMYPSIIKLAMPLNKLLSPSQKKL